MKIANILSIAGSDPSGGAGIQADLKTFAALDAYGMAVLTALTAQNTCGVTAVHVPSPEFLLQQLDAIFADIRVDAVKIGMLANQDCVKVVAKCLKHYRPEHIVLDPVLVATSGDSLATPDIVQTIIDELFPIASVVTPNLTETAVFAQMAPAHDLTQMAQAGHRLLALGAQAVLVKGGHSDGAQAIDLLVTHEKTTPFGAERVITNNTHGTGCTLSSAIAVRLGQSYVLEQAIESAKTFLTRALHLSDRLSVGHGHGPVFHAHHLGQDDVK